MQITKELIDKIDHLLSFGLVKGLGIQKEGEMCVEAAIAFALGKEHTDKNYECVLPFVNSIKIILNDCYWSSNKARAKGMRNLAIAQLGSNVLDENEFKDKLEINSNKKLLPYLIRKHKENKPDETKNIEKIEAYFEPGSKELRYALYHRYSYYYYYYYYNNNYNNYNYSSNFTDEWLLLIADTILDVLKDMKSPGCDWL